MKRWYIGAALTAAVLAVAGAFWLTADPGPTNASADEAAPQPEVAVTVAPVVRRTMHDYVMGYGTVEPEPAQNGHPPADAQLAAPVAGLISAVLASEGQHVERGATLIRLDTRVADVGVQRAQEAVRYGEQLVARQQALGPGQATSMKAYQDAQQQLAAARNDLARAETERSLLEIKAPFSGTVVRNVAKLGQPVDTTMVLLELIDLDRLVVNASVRSVDVGQVKVGQTVNVSLREAPGSGRESDMEAKVDYIAAQVNAATDTVAVRGKLPPGTGLRPGQFVNAQVLVDEHPSALAVPVDSVVMGDKGAEIAIVQGDTAVKMPVTTGIREGNLVEVKGNGLRDGMQVVVQGAYGLPERSKIRVIGR